MSRRVISCRAILHELGLQGKVTTEQLSKKWDNMKRRYKVSGLMALWSGLVRSSPVCGLVLTGSEGVLLSGRS